MTAGVYSEDHLVEQPTVALFAVLGWTSLNCYEGSPAALDRLGGQAALPAANQPVPARILAAMNPGRDNSRAEITAATGITDADWTWAIRQLKEQGRVVQMGERRGARYSRRSEAIF